MSELIKHECGIALIRLLKPLEYYRQKYGSWSYGLQKLYLLMEKQHNRGQDGAGLVTVKLQSDPGQEYIDRVRSNKREPIRDVFKIIGERTKNIITENTKYDDCNWVKNNMPFAGEVMLGHLRYGTFGKNDIGTVHPVLRRSNWKSKSLALAGNFNLTNVDEIFDKLISLGQHPREYTDTITILENVGHFLDDENERIFQSLKEKGHSKFECTPIIQKELDVFSILRNSSKRWDGGYVIGGIIGHGDAFVVRDPWGIRPAFYYVDDEVVVVASERPVIQTAFNVSYKDVYELPAGEAIVVKRDGTVKIDVVRESFKKKSCSFERIYFSRGSDKDIYLERKRLGEYLTDKVLKSIDYDLENTVFSYIPNTAETAFYGLIKGLENYTKEHKLQQLLDKTEKITEEKLREIIFERPRVEKVAIKDIKLRTFITQDNDRDDLVKHVYDVTYGIIRDGVDNLVVIDDSIVRGTTLKQSIIKILDRLNPKKIIIVSSAPQIRYPDCYGIDMAKLGDFVAFRAAIELLKERNMSYLIDEVYEKSLKQVNLPKEKIVNYVKEIYAPFTYEEISDKIAELLTDNDVKAEVKIVYQTIEDLHRAIPEHTGDWYFTGNYPTPGGNKVVNKSFINYIEGKKERAY